MPLTITVETADGRAVLEVRGEIDIRSAPELRAELESALDGGAVAVELDLRAVTFLDSTALSVMVGAHKRLARAGGALEVVVGASAVRRILEVTGLNRVFRVRDAS